LNLDNLGDYGNSVKSYIGDYTYRYMYYNYKYTVSHIGKEMIMYVLRKSLVVITVQMTIL